MIGDRRAREMLFLCEEVDAARCLDWGLVNRVTPSLRTKTGEWIHPHGAADVRKALKEGAVIDLEPLDEAVKVLADKLVDKFPECTRYTKQQVNFWKDLAWHSTIGHARDWLSVHFTSWEPNEGMNAFVEKRPPDYRGLRERAARRRLLRAPLGAAREDVRGVRGEGAAGDDELLRRLRRSAVTRLLDRAEAVSELVPQDACVAVGGMHMTAAPMALVRELVRQEVRIGRLVTSPSASIQADLPIGAELVDELVAPYVGFEDLGLAPRFRRAVEQGSVRLLESDEGGLTHALYAGAGGIPFVPLPPGIERTDIPKRCPDLYREVQDPFTGEARWAIRAIRPDVALIACAEADREGNVAFGRVPFTDRLMALAARRLVVQVERVVDTDAIAARAPGETLPAFLVSAVVVEPGGCAPTASPGFYSRDDAALKEYLERARA